MRYVAASPVDCRKMVIPRGYRQLTPAGAVAAAPASASSPQADRWELLQRFDRFLVGLGRAPATRRLYVAAVRGWLEIGGAAGHCDHARAVSWIGALRRTGAGQSAVNARLKALRAFYGFAAAAGLASMEAVHQVPRQRHTPPGLPRTMDDAAIGALLAAPDLSTFDGLRDHLVLRVLYDTGLRSGELASLTVGDVLPDRMLYVAGGTRRHDRYVPIAESTWLLLQDYLALRASRRVGKLAALWIGASGRPLRGPRAVWELVDRHARAAGGQGSGFRRLRRTPWRGGAYPHLLRASFAAAMIERGAPLTAVAQLLGHAAVGTTARFLGLDVTTLRAACAKHPRSRRDLVGDVAALGDHGASGPG